MRPSVILLVAALLLAGGLAADGRYRDIFIGNKPAGLAGAFIGVADDNNAPWYNPAGMVLIEGASVGTSPSFESHANGRSGSFLGEDEAEVSVLFVPTALSSVSDALGGKVGLGIFMPVKTAFTQTTQVYGFDDGSTVWNGLLDRMENEEIFYLGASYGYAFNETVAVGGGLYYVSSTYSHNLFLLTVEDGNDAHYQEADFRETASRTGYCGMASIMVRPSERFRLGCTLWSQTVLNGSGLYRGVTTSVGDVFDWVVNGRDGAFDTGNPKQVIPGRFGIGIAWQMSPAWLMAFDIINYFGTSYRMFDAGRVTIEPVSDFSLGFEWRITPHVPFRFGIYSNRSYFPAINSQDEFQEPHVDLSGLTVGAGYEGSRNRFFGCLKVGSGTGRDKMYDVVTGTYVPIDAASYTVAIQLGMSYNF